MTKRITVTVEKETRKALLVTDGTRRGWIQKRWMDSVNSVSVETFVKSASKFEGEIESREAAKRWANEYHPIRVDKETEKAVATRVTFISGDGEQFVDRLLWFPRSMMNQDGVPGWMIDRKVDEVKSGFSSNACAFLDPADADRLYA